MLKRTSKLNVLALYDVAALNKRFSTPIKLNYFSNEKTTDLSVKFTYFCFCYSYHTVVNFFQQNSRMLTMLEKSRSNKSDYHSENIQESFYSNRAPKLSQVSQYFSISMFAKVNDKFIVSCKRMQLKNSSKVCVNYLSPKSVPRISFRNQR